MTSRAITPVASDAYFDAALTGVPVVVILRGFGPEDAVRLATQAWDAGVPVVEVPLQGERTAAALKALAELPRAKGQLVGAGTVITQKLAEQAAELGAEFTIAPGWDQAVADASLQLGMPHLPGVSTPTEIQTVLRYGLGWVKAFPADALGLRWFKGIKGPFPDLKIIATGGVDGSNAVEILDAGANGIALGSSFAATGAATLELIAARR